MNPEFKTQLLLLLAERSKSTNSILEFFSSDDQINILNFEDKINSFILKKFFIFNSEESDSTSEFADNEFADNDKSIIEESVDQKLKPISNKIEIRDKISDISEDLEEKYHKDIEEADSEDNDNTDKEIEESVDQKLKPISENKKSIFGKKYL